MQIRHSDWFYRNYCINYMQWNFYSPRFDNNCICSYNNVSIERNIKYEELCFTCTHKSNFNLLWKGEIKCNLLQYSMPVQDIPAKLSTFTLND